MPLRKRREIRDQRHASAVVGVDCTRSVVVAVMPRDTFPDLEFTVAQSRALRKALKRAERFAGGTHGR